MTKTPKRSWTNKFADAFRGVALGVQGQRSFRIHFAAAAAVVVAGFLLGVSPIQWCVLVLAISTVLTAEMFNSALEWMAKAVDREHNVHLAGALDIGAAAVLVAAFGAVAVGAIIFLNRLSAVLSSTAGG